jgi:hypothetical protein
MLCIGEWSGQHSIECMLSHCIAVPKLVIQQPAMKGKLNYITCCHFIFHFC